MGSDVRHLDLLRALSILLPRGVDQSSSEIERQDGTVAKKGLAQIADITGYIREHNVEVAANGGRHPATGREKLREVLLSGGDPMVLPNAKIAAWLGALAEAGVESIRIGTKEMAFFPERFDDTFLGDAGSLPRDVSRRGPAPDGALQPPGRVPRQGRRRRLHRGDSGFRSGSPPPKRAMEGSSLGGWISVENQSPIIKDINDDPDALRIMQRAMKRVGAENHYFFCGRDIVAHKAFNVPDRDRLAGS